MKGKMLKGSYTIEAAIYIPIILFLLFGSVDLGIQYWQRSRERNINPKVEELDIVQEFYGYQILEEIGEELKDDKS